MQRQNSRKSANIHDWLLFFLLCKQRFTKARLFSKNFEMALHIQEASALFLIVEVLSRGEEGYWRSQVPTEFRGNPAADFLPVMGYLLFAWASAAFCLPYERIQQEINYQVDPSISNVYIITSTCSTCGLLLEKKKEFCKGEVEPNF